VASSEVLKHFVNQYSEIIYYVANFKYDAKHCFLFVTVPLPSTTWPSSHLLNLMEVKIRWLTFT